MPSQGSTSAEDLAEKVSRLPRGPGVYLMRDRRDAVIYVGKAKSLRSRVRSYFQRLQDVSPKTRLMVARIADIETIITPTEKDALILENNLIKQYRPRFNVIFRDDKEYPYLRLSTEEPYPNLTIVRRPRKNGSSYFGPFASAQSVRETLKVIHRIFCLRKCSGKRLEKGRPCIYHQLGQCPAPCSRPVTPNTYRKTVREVQLFLQGRSRDILKDLKAEMARESKALHFEQAARLRDRITAIEKTLQRQSVVCLDFVDRDVFSFCRRDGWMAVTTLFVRGGRTCGSRTDQLKNMRLPDDEILASFVSQYYYRGEFIPSEILVPMPLPDRDVIEAWLKEERGRSIRLVVPRRGPKKELLAMAARNAEEALARRLEKKPGEGNALLELQQRLQLKNHPARIECFDISNILGSAAVGAMVVFIDGAPCKKEYRKFRIKTVDRANDYAMMEEMLSRHLDRTGPDKRLPDLIVLDGGKGQLGVLGRLLEDRGLSHIGRAALAKGPSREQAKRRQEEKLFLPNRKNPVSFPKNSAALFLLQRVRDEAHRFAVSYYHQVKKAQDFSSVLEGLSGIGAETVKAVLRHFGSLEGVRRAGPEELAAVPKVSRERAAIIYNYFHPKSQGPQ